MRRFLLLLALVLAGGCGEEEGGAAASAPLPDVPWSLISGIDVAGWEAHAPSATFADGTVSGSNGCNRFTGPYTVDGDQLEIGQVAVTEMACEPPADAVERAFMAALEEVAGWSVEDGELTLSDADGKELLRFGVPSIEGAWDATAFLHGGGVSSPLPGTAVTATFSADGSLSGSAGCNTYNTTYTVDGAKLTIGKEIATTRMMCAEPAGLMEAEAEYIAALPRAVAYRVEGTMLSLLTAEGTYVATYVRKS